MTTSSRFAVISLADNKNEISANQISSEDNFGLPKAKRSRHRGLSEADLRRAIRVAREADPCAIIEITKDISIRILPSDNLPY